MLQTREQSDFAQEKLQPRRSADNVHFSLPQAFSLHIFPSFPGESGETVIADTNSFPFPWKQITPSRMDGGRLIIYCSVKTETLAAQKARVPPREKQQYCVAFISALFIPVKYAIMLDFSQVFLFVCLF